MLKPLLFRECLQLAVRFGIICDHISANFFYLCALALRLGLFAIRDLAKSSVSSQLDKFFVLFAQF